MKVKQPIQLASLLQFYAYGNALNRPKQQLIAELADIGQICDFLIEKIPTTIKGLRQTIKSHHKGIKDLSANIRQSINMAVEDPKLEQYFCLQSAYDQLSHFTLNKLVDNDYCEKTLAEKEMKLKFMQSENLPDDFIWEKPIKSVREAPGRKQNKDYSWHSYFNNKYHMLEVNTRKYKILISMTVANNSYIWAIDRIALKASQESVYYMMKYFEEKIKPVIRSKFGDSYEENMLSSINKYSYYLELMDLNFNLCTVTSNPFFSQRIVVKHNSKDYEFIFNNPEQLDDAILTITQVDNPSIVVRLWFLKKQITCILEIGETVLSTVQQFKYQNFKALMILLEQLVEYSNRVLSFFKNLNPFDFQQNLFIKLAGMYWISGNDWLGKSNYYHINENGPYIGKIVQGTLLYSSILADGSLSSVRINRAFLTKLLSEVKVEIFFNFCYIIEKLLKQNQYKQAELDHYYVSQKEKDKKVILYFKKKSSIEEQMMKLNSKAQYTEEETFNLVKFTAEFALDFRTLTFFQFRDPDQKIAYEKQDWKSHFKVPAPQVLDISKVIEAIQYLQDNFIFQFVIQKKMKMDSKPLYSIKI